MKNQNRAFKVWMSLVASMTLGAVVLMAVDRKTVSDGAFSLAGYVQLSSVEQIVLDSIKAAPGNWNRVQVFFSGTSTSHTDKILQKFTGSDGVQFHFIVCNGIGSDNEGKQIADGQIEYTTQWVQQKPCLGSEDATIRICVVSDGIVTVPTDSQIKRVAMLVRLFNQRLGVPSKNISFPANWQM
ncbi:MAG: hypothetical protein GX455_12015 [Phycisphaerae bacterium]|nr:hypothetical protein [Phycisphaerae bacterium]